MEKLVEIASGKRRDPPRRPGRELALAGAVFAGLCTFVFVHEVWSARLERSRLEQALGGHPVLLTEIEAEGRLTCGSYRMVGARGTWLFVHDRQRLWPQSALPSEDLPPDVEHEYVACDTYQGGGRYSRTSAFWFAPQVLAVANWRLTGGAPRPALPRSAPRRSSGG
jgi:hypothetical protein